MPEHPSTGCRVAKRSCSIASWASTWTSVTSAVRRGTSRPLYRPSVPLWYSNACFTLVVVGISFMHTWLRLRSQSVWPSALFHAAGNAFQGVLQAATLETSITQYLTTEYGASFAAVGCLVALLFWSRRHEVQDLGQGTSPIG